MEWQTNSIKKRRYINSDILMYINSILSYFVCTDSCFNFYLCENFTIRPTAFHKLDINGITMRNCWITKRWKINFI